MDKIKEEYSKLNNVVFIDIEQLAKDNNVPRSANMILLGAAQKSLGIGYEESKGCFAECLHVKAKRSLIRILKLLISE